MVRRVGVGAEDFPAGGEVFSPSKLARTLCKYFVNSGVNSHFRWNGSSS